MNRLPVFLLLMLCCHALEAQEYRLHGLITDARLQPLALASISLRDSKTGALSNERGEYSMMLEPGEYQLTVSMMGYQSRVFKVIMTRAANEQNLILETDESAISLGEVVVNSKTRDRSREILREVIRRKEQIADAAGAYSVQLYIKAVQEDSTQRAKRKKRPKNRLPLDTLPVNPTAELDRMAMAEILLQYDYSSPKRMREERTAVKRRGNAEALFFLSTTEGDFNFYNNLVNVPTVSTTPLLSPVSYSGLAAYRTRVVSTRINRSGRKEYTISVRPGKLSNATVSGEIVIEDSTWLILHTRFELPSYHLPSYDHFEVEQDYAWVNDRASLLSRQQFTYYSKTNKGKKSGSTVVSYTGYELGKHFEPGHFGTEVSSVTAEAYQRDTTFWNAARSEPLTPKELRFIRYKDSLFQVTHSKAYLDSIDAVTNRVTVKKILLTGQPMWNREKERMWQFPSLVTLAQPVQFGGFRVQPQVSMYKVYPSRKTVNLFAKLSYGLRNKDLNGAVSFSKMYNPFNRAYYRVEAKRDFQYIYSGDAWINMLKRSNLYLDNSIGVAHGRELFNGFFVSGYFDIAFRRSLANYKTNDLIDSVLDLDNNMAIPFTPYNASYGRIELRYTPFQRYIREPREKIILGSYWPTVFVNYRKGIPKLFRSDVDFDYLEFGLQQTIKLGLTGVSSYTIRTGDFLNTTDLRLIDYKFQRRGDPLLFLNPNEAFQMLDSTFPLFRRFYELHYVHEFNGAILNKIPLLKRLNLREVAGAGFLSAPERRLRYGELFAGVERVFKAPFNIPQKFKLGVYVVGSAANQFRNPVQFKVGITSWDKQRGRWF